MRKRLSKTRRVRSGRMSCDVCKTEDHQYLFMDSDKDEECEKCYEFESTEFVLLIDNNGYLEVEDVKMKDNCINIMCESL